MTGRGQVGWHPFARRKLDWRSPLRRGSLTIGSPEGRSEDLLESGFPSLVGTLLEFVIRRKRKKTITKKPPLNLTKIVVLLMSLLFLTASHREH